MTHSPLEPVREPATVAGGRPALRRELLSARKSFAEGPALADAEASLARHVCEVILQLEPQCLGLYWPMQSEFNAPAAVEAHLFLTSLPLALPFARKAPIEMHYRRWNRRPPTLRDECGILSGEGALVVPDVVLVPCLGFTPAGYRLGYGGGYFDRWLALHPQVTAVGVAWSHAALSDAALAPKPHDQALALVVTEQGVVSA